MAGPLELAIARATAELSLALAEAAGESNDQDGGPATTSLVSYAAAGAINVTVGGARAAYNVGAGLTAGTALVANGVAYGAYHVG